MNSANLCFKVYKLFNFGMSNSEIIHECPEMGMINQSKESKLK